MKIPMVADLAENVTIPSAVTLAAFALKGLPSKSWSTGDHFRHTPAHLRHPNCWGPELQPRSQHLVKVTHLCSTDGRDYCQICALKRKTGKLSAGSSSPHQFPVSAIYRFNTCYFSSFVPQYCVEISLSVAGTALSNDSISQVREPLPNKLMTRSLH